MSVTMPYVSKQHDQEWTALGYGQLIASLGSLTRLGAFEEGSLTAALAVARLIDRGRILRSGLRASELRRTLERYRTGLDWRPNPAIERALEQAITIAAEIEGVCGTDELENEAQPAANTAG